MGSVGIITGEQMDELAEQYLFLNKPIRNRVGTTSIKAVTSRTRSNPKGSHQIGSSADTSIGIPTRRTTTGGFALNQRSNNGKHFLNLAKINQRFARGENCIEHNNRNLPTVIPGQER